MNDLLKELKLGSLDWKGYLLSGLGPIVFFWFGVTLCLHGLQGVEDTLAQLFQKPSDFVAKSATVVTACLVCGAILYGLRPVTIDFLRRMPIPGLRFLMMEWSVWKKSRAEGRLWHALWKMDVARWHNSEFDYHQYLSPAIRHLYAAATLENAIAGTSEVVSNLKNSDSLSWRFSKRKVFKKLQQLHVQAGKRTLVEDYASALAQKGHGTNEDNWAAAEAFYGFKAPEETLFQEIDKWRTAFHFSSISEERIRSFDDYRLFDEYRRAVLRCQHYPSKQWIGPTGLANILAALEDYAADRYGIDTELLWSRLEMVIPKDQREQLASYQRTLSALLHMTLAFVVLAVFAGIQGYQHQQLRCLAVPVAIGALIASRLCLSAAEYSAAGLASKIEAAVDQGVPTWLQSIGLHPETAGARLETLQQLAKYFGGGTALPENFRFNLSVRPVVESKSRAGD